MAFLHGLKMKKIDYSFLNFNDIYLLLLYHFGIIHITTIFYLHYI